MSISQIQILYKQTSNILINKFSLHFSSANNIGAIITLQITSKILALKHRNHYMRNKKYYVACRMEIYRILALAN